MSSTFGSWLKQRRKSLGLSQQELAKQVGCSAALIRKIESGERRTSKQIAELLAHSLKLSDDERVSFLQSARQPHHTPPQLAISSTPQLLSPLTARERDILQLMAADLSNDEIAERLVMTVGTVRWYTKEIYSKLGVHSRDEAIAFAENLQKAEDSTANAAPISSRLPVATTLLVGRQNQITAICTLLNQPHVRLLTLIGTAGIGKTRLSLEVAASLTAWFPDGVYFVPLAPLSDPAFVANTIMRVMNIPEMADQPIIDVLTAYLREKHLLLVLDNFEHLLDAATLVADLLAAAPYLKVIATSRERLRLYGEHEYPVPPLILPDPEQADDLNTFTQFEAVKLFVQRAQAAKPDFQLTSKNINTVAEICVRLDGLPLALELAAARIRLYPPDTLLSRLNKRLNTLTGGARDLPERQQTLRGAIGWSYDLLSAGERVLFARLGIFVGGWTFAAMEAICSYDLPMDVYDGLESLLNKSLVQQTTSEDGDLRFMMLETIREYALEKLHESGEVQAVRERYERFFVEMVEHAEPLLRTAVRAVWLAQLRAEDSNIRSILREIPAYGLEDDTPLRLATALWQFWATEGRYYEGINWLQGLLDRTTNTVLPALRTRALHAYAALNTYLLNWAQASEHFHEVVKLALSVGDDWCRAHALAWMGRIHFPHQKSIQVQWLVESLSLARQLGDPWLIATSLVSHGMYYRYYENFSQSCAAIEEALAIVQELGLVTEIGLFTVELGETLASQGDLNGAISLMTQGIDQLRKTRNSVTVADGLNDLGDVQRLLGDYDQARLTFEEAFQIWQKYGIHVRGTRVLYKLGFVVFHQNNLAHAETIFRQTLEQGLQNHSLRDMTRNMALAFVGLAKIAAERKAYTPSVTLVGAADAQLQTIERSFTTLTPADRMEVDSLVALLQRELDPTTYAAGWENGAHMTLDELLMLAQKPSSG